MLKSIATAAALFAAATFIAGTADAAGYGTPVPMHSMTVKPPKHLQVPGKIALAPAHPRPH